MVTTRTASITAICLAILLVAACTRSTPHQPPPTSTAGPVANDDYSFRWIPNPAIDLMSPEGTFIRAAAESWDRLDSAHSTGLDAVKERGYPGFSHAYNDSFPAIRDVGGSSGDYPRVGTEYFEVVDLRREGDRYTADVCIYLSQTAVKQNGRYVSGGSVPANSGTARTYTFGPDPKIGAVQQHSPMANLKGPARQPTDNVFGTWVLFPLADRTRDTINNLARRCQKLAPGTPPNWPDPHYWPEPPPVLSPDPGWPAGGA